MLPALFCFDDGHYKAFFSSATLNTVRVTQHLSAKGSTKICKINLQCKLSFPQAFKLASQTCLLLKFVFKLLKPNIYPPRAPTERGM